MQKIIIDLGKPMRDAVAGELEKYCKNIIKKSPENGPDWAFGAVEFARIANLIDLGQYMDMLSKCTCWEKEEDPSGGNRTGSRS